MRPFCLILLALLPNIMAQEKEIWRKREVTNEKRAAHNVTPHYVAEAIGSSRSGAWHFTWQTVFFIGQMTTIFTCCQDILQKYRQNIGKVAPTRMSSTSRKRGHVCQEIPLRKTALESV